MFTPNARTALQKVMTTPVTMGYWIGDDDLARKTLTLFVVNTGKNHASETISSDSGKPWNMVLPPSSQVASPPGT